MDAGWRRSRSAGAVGVGLAMALAAGAQAAGDGMASDAASPYRFEYQPVTEPTPEIAKAADAAPPPVFGAAGTKWWTVGADLSYAFNGSTDTGLHGSYSYFMARDVELAGELGLWYFNQPGDNAAGLSLSMVFRWHFINTGIWTVYADAGIGVLGATDEVPDGGTSFDFVPRAGVGFTTRLSEEDGVRLQMGLRWHHISNARIYGDENNPARDQALVYAGIIWPF